MADTHQRSSSGIVAGCLLYGFTLNKTKQQQKNEMKHFSFDEPTIQMKVQRVLSEQFNNSQPNNKT